MWGAAIAAVSLLLGLVSSITVARRIAEARPGQESALWMGADLDQAPGVVARKRMKLWDRCYALVDCGADPVPKPLSSRAWRSMMVRSLNASERRTGWHTRGPDLPIMFVVHEYGWPMRSFFIFDVQSEGQPLLTVPPESEWKLPFAPGPALWWPLLVNTLVFASPWMLLLSLPPLFVFAVRERRRRRLGRCPACNYNRVGLATDAVCPECGVAP